MDRIADFKGAAALALAECPSPDEAAARGRTMGAWIAADISAWEAETGLHHGDHRGRVREAFVDVRAANVSTSVASAFYEALTDALKDGL